MLLPLSHVPHPLAAGLRQINTLSEAIAVFCPRSGTIVASGTVAPESCGRVRFVCLCSGTGADVVYSSALRWRAAGSAKFS